MDFLRSRLVNDPAKGENPAAPSGGLSEKVKPIFGHELVDAFVWALVILNLISLPAWAFVRWLCRDVRRNVRSGGTAETGRPERSERETLPAVATTVLSASCPSLVVSEFIRQLEKRHSELSCLLAIHLDRIVMRQGDDFYMDGSPI